MELMITPDAMLDTLSFDEGVAELQRLEEEARGVMRSIKERQKDLVRTRFKQGKVVSLITEGATYGDSAVAKLAEGSGVSERVLYEARRFFEMDQFERSFTRLEAWITDTEERKGVVNWSYARQIVQNKLDGDPEIRKSQVESRVRRLEKRAESLEHDAEDLSTEVQTDEAHGVAAKAKEVAADMRREAAQLLNQDQTGPHRDDAYLAFVRSHWCCACEEDRADAHHLTTGGKSIKGSDYLTVPLCREHHTRLHSMGLRGFERSFELNLWRTSSQLLVEYFTGRRP